MEAQRGYPTSTPPAFGWTLSPGDTSGRKLLGADAAHGCRSLKKAPLLPNRRVDGRRGGDVRAGLLAAERLVVVVAEPTGLHFGLDGHCRVSPRPGWASLPANQENGNSADFGSWMCNDLQALGPPRQAAEHRLQGLGIEGAEAFVEMARRTTQR